MESSPVSDDLVTDDIQMEIDRDVFCEQQLVKSLQSVSDGIVIDSLRKEYPGGFGEGPKVAVDNLSLRIPRGECFGLLGPNGAGKTTAISVLTGLFPPTSGIAFIAGFNILNNMDDVHRNLSVCPQFDTLWECLTCEETLLFYARLKGISPKEEKRHVHEILREVGLGDVINRQAGNLSGGMKRRLSIAIAIVGNCEAVFLDEPTTGLDPETRRYIWDIIIKYKQGRSMILTTHSMEEADIICSRIGIMSRGRLKCLGTPLHLKSKFGEGYRLAINYLPDDEERAMEFVEKHYPDARLKENFAGTCTYQLPKQRLCISDLFATMESHKGSNGIIDWSINQTSLEDVFLNVVKEDEELTVAR